MADYPFPTTTLQASPDGSSFTGVKILAITSGGALQQIPASLIPNAPTFISVMAHGATGNGSTDDTTAIQAAFAAAVAGSVVIFPPGKTFKMTSYVTIGVDRLTIIGTGAKIISNASGQDRKFSAASRTGLVFRDLNIDGGGFTTLSTADITFDTYTPRNQPGTIHLTDCTNCEISGCNIKGVNWPVTILGACSDVKVHDNTFATYFAAVYSYFSGADGVGNPAPERILVCNNRFLAGKYAPIVTSPSGSPRVYPTILTHCSGAIKFRCAYEILFFTPRQCVVAGNIINAAGMMGIELQGDCNDSTVSGNTVVDCDIGVSISLCQRVTIAGNTIRNMNYTCIEIDGRYDGRTDLESCDTIAITGNVLDSRDEFGRPFDFFNNVGIVVSNISRNVTISGGSINHCKTGILVETLSGRTLIEGVRITTNGNTGTGGLNGDQGILIFGASGVDIIGCMIEPGAGSKQRMINILESSKVNIRGGTITSGNTGVYIHNSTDVSVEGLNVTLAATGGANPSFITVDSTDIDCLNIRIARNRFIGAATFGISLYAPAHTIGPVWIYENDTTRASCAPGNRFVLLGASGTGSILKVDTKDNVGPGDISEQNNIQVAVLNVTAATWADSPTIDATICNFDMLVNLQTAVGYNGKQKTFVLATTFSTVTLRPITGQTINGSTADVLITTQWAKVVLVSDGSNWISVG